MGIEDFGAQLKRLLADPRNNCSASCLAAALEYSDATTIYRWMRGEKTPALDTSYHDQIVNHLKLTQAEAQELRSAQIRALTDRKLPKPPKRPRRVRRARQQRRAPIAPLIDRWTQGAEGAPPYRATSPGAKGTPILSRIIELFERLPDAASRSDEDRTIFLTWQSRDASEMSAELEERWLVALRSVLQRGWQIEYLCRLDRNIHRTVRLVELMRDLVGTGAYTPRYFRNYGVLSPPYDLIIIPGIAGVTLFATHGAHAVDDGLITQDANDIRVLQAHARQLADQSTPLVTAYFALADDLAYGERLRDAEDRNGGRVVIKDGLSVTTQPEWWFDEPPTAAIPAGHTSERWEIVAGHRKARIAAFKRYVLANEYYDICTERAIEQLVRTGVYPEGDPSIGPRQGKPSVLEHLRNTVELLRTYEHYHLALVSDYQANDAGPKGIQMSAKWQVAGDDTVFMGICAPDHDGHLVPANLHITEPTVAHGFREHFYELWARIPPIKRERAEVIAWLERQIGELECVLSRSPD